MCFVFYQISKQKYAKKTRRFDVISYFIVINLKIDVKNRFMTREL